MEDFFNMSEEIVHQLQLLQQNVESLVDQKRVISEQIFEMNSAIKSLPGSIQSYKIVGKLLISKDVAVLEKELATEKESLELKMSEIEIQEKAIQEKMGMLQKELVAINTNK
jgi:prefoldin beta subunit